MKLAGIIFGIAVAWLALSLFVSLVAGKFIKWGQGDNQSKKPGDE